MYNPQLCPLPTGAHLNCSEQFEFPHLSCVLDDCEASYAKLLEDYLASFGHDFGT